MAACPQREAIAFALEDLQSVWTKVSRIALIHERPQRAD